MTSRNHGYLNGVDALIEQTPLDLVLQHYGLPLSESASAEHRMKCVFNESCSDSQYGNLSIKHDSAKRIYCHSCETKGNLLTLLHGLETHRPPEGGRLRGQEFKAAVAKLREINGLADSPAPSTKDSQYVQTPIASEKPVVASKDKEPESPPVNIPLKRHEKQAARELENLYEELVTDVSQMSPEAAAYVRKRPWMTEELMKKWGIGWIPGNGRSLFRKNYFVYTHRNIRNEVISYSGRDLTFEAKWTKWLKQGKPEGKKPNKHRYVAGFHRGAELFGGQASRLNEAYIIESLTKHGLVVVEGMNDVIRMDALGVAAAGLCSNKPTQHQIDKLVEFARQVADNRVLLLPDCDEEGESGFKELLWQLAERQVGCQLAMSSETHSGQFAGRQPESFTEVEWPMINARHES